jgi:DNA-binding IclR family transcriptional regulator
MPEKEIKPSIRSVVNAFSALEFIVERTLENGGASLTEIAGHLAMQKTTARNLMQTMELCGYIDRKGYGFYALGEKCKSLIMAAESSNRMRNLSIPVLSAFSRRNKVAILLSVFYNGKRYISLSVDSRGVPQESCGSGDTVENVYRRAATRLLLAYASCEGRKGFIDRYGLPPAEAWQEGAADLESALQKIREEGVAVNEHNTVSGLAGIAAGVFNSSGKLCAALSLSLPGAKWQGELKKHLFSELKEVSEELTKLFSAEQLM